MIALLFASAVAWANPGQVSAYAPTPYEALCIQYAAERHDVPYPIMRWLAWAESRDNPFAYRRNANGSNDAGPFQLNNRTWEWLRHRYHTPHASRWSWCESSEMAAHYLSDLYTVLADWNLTIEAYNAGIHAVQLGEVRSSTVVYARAILTRASGTSGRMR